MIILSDELTLKKIEAKNLSPFTQYYYQFNVCGSENKSPLGRTKTTPNADDDITDVSLAVYSCANYPFGFFNAYGNVARKVSQNGNDATYVELSSGLGLCRLRYPSW